MPQARDQELLTNYGEIGVLWFDGQWEHNWTDERGRDLYAYVRGLQPNIVINSRVGRAGGDFGLDRQSGMLGDYGTPEQTIPEFAIPDMPWETCMTMNGHWGYNAADKNFKTSEDLIRKLADIASKGGNFLLNVGPTGEGKIPATSIERLKEMGEWMKVNGESIYGTVAGPMPLAWGCVTRADAGGGNTRLYVHVNEPPKDGVLVLPGLLNTPVSAGVMGGGAVPADKLTRKDDAVVIAAPGLKADSVVRLDIQGTPDVAIPPTIKADAPIFVGSTTVTITSDRKDVEVRATIDGTDPVATSPIASTLTLKETATVAARCFRAGKSVSPVAKETLTRVQPTAAVNVAGAVGGRQGAHRQRQAAQLPRAHGRRGARGGAAPDQGGVLRELRRL